MDDQKQRTSSLPPSQKQSARPNAFAPRVQRWLAALRARPPWYRSRAGRIVMLLLLFLLGVAAGLSALFWYGISGEGRIVIVPQSARGSIIVEANTDFVTQLVRQDLTNDGLPGEVKNVKVELKHGAEMIISGDDVNTVLGVQLVRHFTVYMQPYVQSCLLQARVTRADLGGLPVTTFVQSFQGSINRQLAQKPSGLPDGFIYCTAGVRTEPGGLFVTYQATAIS